MKAWSAALLALIWVVMAPVRFAVAADMTLWCDLPTVKAPQCGEPDSTLPLNDLARLHVYVRDCAATQWAELLPPQNIAGLEGDSVGVHLTGLPDGKSLWFAERVERSNGVYSCWGPTYAAAFPAVEIPAGGAPGLIGSYYRDKYLSSLVGTRVDPMVAFDWTTGSPFPGCPADSFSVRWTGYLVAPATGLYSFRMHVNDAGRVVIGPWNVLDDWATGDGWHDVSGSAPLTANTLYPVTIDMREKWYICGAQLYWTPPGQAETLVPQSAWSH